MKRPPLRQVSLNWALNKIISPGSGFYCITMSVSQWDKWLDGAYRDGWVLLELDANERPIAAYQKKVKKNVFTS